MIWVFRVVGVALVVCSFVFRAGVAVAVLGGALLAVPGFLVDLPPRPGGGPPGLPASSEEQRLLAEVKRRYAAGEIDEETLEDWTAEVLDGRRPDGLRPSPLANLPFPRPLPDGTTRVRRASGGRGLGLRRAPRPGSRPSGPPRGPVVLAGGLSAREAAESMAKLRRQMNEAYRGTSQARTTMIRGGEMVLRARDEYPPLDPPLFDRPEMEDLPS